VTGLEVIKLSEIEATSLGTALFCRAGIDKSKSLREAARDWIKAAKRYLPETHATDEYRVVAQLFHDYMEATRDIYKGLNGLISHSAS
jgi:sugar (pentulose or hexulose) kinase